MSRPAARLPTAEQVAEHLEAHTPRPPAAWLRYVPLGVVVAAVLVSLAVTTWWAALLPWVALLGVVMYGVGRRQRRTRLAAQALYAQELGMLRHHRAALRLAWSLLPQLIHRPDDHARTVALLGHTLGVLGDDDAALAAYAYLLERLPDGHPAALTLRLQMAAAYFEADRLSDGDAELRKVRASIPANDPSPLGAAYRATRLLQSIRTHHFADAVADLPDPVAALRPLGLDAGLAYGLIALARKQLGDAEGASRAWADATCLLPADELVQRFAPLRAFTERGQRA